jgi:hypothetical protein
MEKGKERDGEPSHASSRSIPALRNAASPALSVLRLNPESCFSAL